MRKRGLCCRRVSVRPSVCQFVRLSRSCIVSRRLKISSNFFLGPVAASLLVFLTRSACTQRSPLLGVPFYLCAHPLLLNYQIWRGNTCGEGRVYWGQPRLPPQVSEVPALSNFMPTPVHPSAQNDQIQHGKGVFLGQPRHCICTNTSRGLSTTAEFLIITRRCLICWQKASVTEGQYHAVASADERCQSRRRKCMSSSTRKPTASSLVITNELDE